MFFQPTFVYPILTPYSPLKYTALIAIIIYFFSRNEKKSDISFFQNKVNKYFVIFIFFQILSASSLWIYHGLDVFNLWLRYGIVYFLIIKLSVTSTRIKLLSVVMVLAISYLSYFSLSEFVLNFEPGMRAGGFGWYENSNDLSVILVSVIPLSYLLFEISNGFFKRGLFFSLTIMFAFNILFTGSRNGLLGLFIVGILSLILSNIPRTFRLGLIVLLFSSIVTVGLTTVLARDDLTALSGDASSEHRVEQWRACYKMIKAHPFLGVGPGESTGEMRNYGGIRGLPPHNTIIQVFAETGIPGGIFFVLFGLSPLVIFLKNIKFLISTKKTELVLYKYFCVSLAGFWVCAIFSNRVLGYQLYVLVALILATLNILKKSGVSGDISFNF